MPESDPTPQQAEQTGAESKPSPASRSARIPLWLCVILVVTPLIAGWPYLVTEGRVTPDGIDYINISRNLANGRGFIHTIKWQYFDDRPVVVPAFGERMPLYPIVITPLVACGGGPRSMAALNLLLTGLAAVCAATLAFRIARSSDDDPPRRGLQAAAAAGLVVGLSPPLLFTASLPLTEPLFILLTFLSVLSLPQPRPGEADSARAQRLAAIAGLLAFAAYLTRSAGIVLIAAEILWLARWRNWRQLLAAGLAFAIPFLLWAAMLKIFRGSYTYSMQNHHLVCLNFAEEMAFSFGRTYPSTFEFVSGNASEIGSRIAWHLKTYAKDLVWTNSLGLLTLLLPLALLRKGRHALIELLCLFAVLNYLFSALVWSTHEGVRFILPSFAALVPVALAAAYRVFSDHRRLRWTPTVAAACVLVFFVPKAVKDGRHALKSRTMPMQLSPEEIQRLDQYVPEMTHIGTDMPFEVNFYCDRPTAETQWNNPAFDLDKMIDKYEIECLALTPDAAHRLRASPWRDRARSVGPIAMGIEWFVVAAESPPEEP